MSAVREADSSLSPPASTRLEQLLRRQRALAWLFSIGTLTATVVFFAMMTLAAPWMSAVVFGHSITVATVAATVIILSFLVLITLFGRQASRIDAELRASQSNR